MIYVVGTNYNGEDDADHDLHDVVCNKWMVLMMGMVVVYVRGTSDDR